MGRASEFSSEKRAQILILRKEGYSLREIAAKMGCTAMGVQKTLKRIDQRGDFASQMRSGRPPVTSPRTDNVIHRMAIAKPSSSSSEMQAEMLAFLLAFHAWPPVGGHA